jgi:prepilin-type processing-associated H-X9-DG protein
MSRAAAVLFVDGNVEAVDFSDAAQYVARFREKGGKSSPSESNTFL